jgi:hypothetical protein
MPREEKRKKKKRKKVIKLIQNKIGASQTIIEPDKNEGTLNRGHRYKRGLEVQGLVSPTLSSARLWWRAWWSALDLLQTWKRPLVSVSSEVEVEVVSYYYYFIFLLIYSFFSI